MKDPAHNPALSESSIRRDIAEMLYLDVDEVTDEADLLELGLDSIRMVSLVDRWRVGGSTVRFDDLAQHTTVGAWIEVLVGS